MRSRSRPARSLEPRRSRPRGSIYDPFKARITRLLETHPYSAQQILQRLREDGYGGGMTILQDYVRRHEQQHGEEQQDNHFGSPVLEIADDNPRWR